MKTQMKIFKNLSKVVLVLSVLLIASCGSDDDGAVEQFATLPAATVTTYNGELSYTSADGMNIVAGVDGTATISGSGTTYSISFSDGVPSITGLRFIGSGNGSYATVNTNGSSAGIVIEDGDLTVGAQVNGNSWAFEPN